MNEILNQLITYFRDLDRAWFLLINREMTHPQLDRFFSFITNLHHHNILFYYVLPVIIVFYFWLSRLKAFKVLLMLSLVFALSDSFSYRVLKQIVKRDRPQVSLSQQVVVRVPYYPQSYSFPSNHALNGFALARILTWMHPIANSWVWLAVSLVAYSRVYVGVHYPSDVIGGAIIGYFLGTIFIRFFFSRWAFFSSLSKTSHKKYRYKK